MYIKAKEEKKWKQFKQEEEKILREHGMDEEQILILRDYDWLLFKSERKFKENQFTNVSSFVEVAIHNQFNELNFDDLIEYLENEKLYLVLKKTDKHTLRMLELRMIGYSLYEIEDMYGISYEAVRQRIQTVKKKIGKI